MRSRILLTILLTVLFVLASGCGTAKNCPVCGTTTNDGYASIDIIPVPEHNPTGEPGGPFNSFDISVVDSANHRFFVSDRIGLDVAVFDTQQDVAVNFFSGANGVAGGGLNASSCATDATKTLFIPPIVTGFGNWTRFGCRTLLFHIPGFGANGLFGGFPGAQCCGARANGVNPLSAPDGEALSPDNKTLFVGNGSASVAAFDLTSTTFSTTSTTLPPGPNVIAEFPTGVSADYDGPNGIAPCVASANGRAFSDGSCGDLRADEMSIGVVNGRTLLLVTNGDPGFPFATIADVTNIVHPTGTFTADHCLPFVPQTAYGPPVVTTGGVVGQGSTAPAAGLINPPTCILGQVYYDGAGINNSGVAVDDQTASGFPCPDPSTTVLSGVSGHGSLGPPPPPGGVVNVLGPDIPCHHGPIIDKTTGIFCNQTAPGGNCAGATSIAGLGGSAFNPNTGHFLVTNSNSSPATLTIGSVDVIDPRVGNPDGPVVVNSFPMPSCMPTSIVQGPGNNFLVGCGDHDGEAFPPNEYVIDGTSGKILATITQVGGVDEIWYNSGDNRYYLAARDMPTGPVMGVIDAKTNLWLQSVVTNSNSHSISVDSTNNHAFVPLQAGAGCTTQSSNGCIVVYAQQ